MSELSPRLELPFIQPSQAQKHVTHNEAIEVLDAIVQLRLESVDQNDPPSSATDGQAWQRDHQGLSRLTAMVVYVRGISDTVSKGGQTV